MQNLVRRSPARALAVAVLVVAASTFPVAAGVSPASAATDACGDLMPKTSGGTWSCTFVDNFDGRDLDTSKWNIQDTQVSGFQLNQTCFTGGNVTLNRGAVNLKVTKSRSAATCSSPYGSWETQYTGGDINSWGKFNQAYGRFEARMKLATYGGAGYQGGFWMNPQGSPYGSWPASGEIDVAEWFSKWPDHTYPTLHYTGSTTADTGTECRVGTWSAYHTYAVEWTSAKMDFLVDGAVCFRRTWTPDSPLVAPQPFDKPFFISLTAAAGGMVNAPTADTPFPMTISVDWVKAWE